MKIREHCYLWNNKNNHDKVYGLFLTEDKKLIKIWGRRNKALRYQIIEDSTYSDFDQIKEQKINKGYYEIKPLSKLFYNILEKQIIEAIDEMVENIIKESPQNKEVNETGKEVEVMCIDNTGIESFYEKGMTYLLIEDQGKTVVVEDMFGTNRCVLKERFKRCEI